ncbi:TetR/AcrR family transcriptional regulator [Fodinicola feengrottensis]|uniref:TetR/AcrR family transcriptional regulator n=1 Tax=Fodinicola feengrottensis TaxID=435914 RepID=UPI0013D8BA8B|nr:TetR/AcrR family transcriptional regulator [Fodinicola feengrottensis]
MFQKHGNLVLVTAEDNPDLGLRDRKKAATREALGAAALRLALTNGPENVRVNDIADAVGVSPRTYNNYFHSTLHAICVALAADRALRVGQAVRTRPADEPLLTVVTEAIVKQYAGDAEPTKETVALITSAPALTSEYAKTVGALEYPLAAAIQARTGPGPMPAVVAAAVSAAARVATENWLQDEETRPFEAVLRESLAIVAPILLAADVRPG